MNDEIVDAPISEPSLETLPPADNSAPNPAQCEDAHVDPARVGEIAALLNTAASLLPDVTSQEATLAATRMFSISAIASSDPRQLDGAYGFDLGSLGVVAPRNGSPALVAENWDSLAAAIKGMYSITQLETSAATTALSSEPRFLETLRGGFRTRVATDIAPIAEFVTKLVEDYSASPNPLMDWLTLTPTTGGSAPETEPTL